MFLDNFKKIINLILSVTIVFSCLFFINYQKTEAWLGVGDVSVDPANYPQNSVTAVSTYGTNYKEFILDTIAYTAARVAVQKIQGAVLEWINSGFDGNPAFMTDPEQFALDIGDDVLGQYIYGEVCEIDSETGEEVCKKGPDLLKFMCSPFSIDVKLALIQNFTSGYESKCTLSEAFENVENATDEMGENWSWNNWITITQNPNNNAYSAFMEASININADINKEQKKIADELNWGSGFLSYKKCETYNEGTPEEMEYCENVTPGDTIADQLNENLKLGGRSLINADEINEIVGALATQLVMKAMSSDGVKGLSKKNGEGKSTLDDLNDDTNKTNQSVTDMKANVDMEGGLNNMLSGFQGVADGFGDGSEGSFGGVANIDFSVENVTKETFKILNPEWGVLFTLYDLYTNSQEEKDYGSATPGESSDTDSGEPNEEESSSCGAIVDGEEGDYVGRTNGNRPTFRFNKPGKDYCGGGACSISIGCGDLKKTYNIPSSGKRYESGSFVWKPVSESNGKLVVLFPSSF